MRTATHDMNFQSRGLLQFNHPKPSERKFSSYAFALVHHPHAADDDSDIRAFLDTGLNNNKDVLTRALDELRHVDRDADFHGYPTPTKKAKRCVERVLMIMYHLLPESFEVYSGPDGEIAVEAESGTGRNESVTILCELSGELVIMTYFLGDQTYDSYTEDNDSFYDSLKAQLRKLISGNTATTGLDTAK